MTKKKKKSFEIPQYRNRSLGILEEVKLHEGTMIFLSLVLVFYTELENFTAC